MKRYILILTCMFAQGALLAGQQLGKNATKPVQELTEEVQATVQVAQPKLEAAEVDKKEKAVTPLAELELIESETELAKPEETKVEEVKPIVKKEVKTVFVGKKQPYCRSCQIGR